MKNTQIIINLKASRAEAKIKKVKRALAKISESQDQLYLVKNPEEIEKTFRKVLKKKPSLIVIGGGDGTIIKTIDWFSDNGYKNNYGILPLGTSNYLARNLGIPLIINEAVSKLNSGSPKKVQFASANGKLFSLMATIGLLTRISKHVEVKNKQRFGQLAYINEGIRQLKNHSSIEYQVEIGNSGKKLTGRAFQLVVFNADLNRQIKVAPASDISEKWLKLSIYDEKSNTFIVLFNILLYMLSLGKIRRGMKTYKSNKFSIKTEPALEVSLDGEISADTPLEITGGKDSAKIII